jgi:hypothetical protein
MKAKNKKDKGQRNTESTEGEEAAVERSERE